MRLLRDLGRRKVRTTLTILGITIGIWALVVFGSMANKINALVAGGSEFYAGKVTVSASGSMAFGSPMALSTADRIARLGSVDVVVPGVSMLMSDEVSGVSMGMPQMIDRPGRRRGPRPRDVPGRHRERARAHPRGRGLGRDRPRLGHRPPERHEGRRHGDPARRAVRGGRDPGAHADGAGHDRDRAAGRRAAAVRQDAPHARVGEARPDDDHQRAHRLPEGRRRPRDGRGGDQGRGARSDDDDRRRTSTARSGRPPRS